MSLTQEQQAIVESFAKSLKISKAKSLSLAESLLASVPTRTHGTTKAGRKVTDKSVEVRNVLKQFHAENQGATFMVPELSKTLGVDIATLNNNIRWLSQQGLFATAGLGEKKGGRGRRPIVWKAVALAS